MKLRVLLSGGGTAGHIYPSLAIAEALQIASPAVQILFVGAHNRMEMTLVPKAGYTIEGLDITGFNRQHLLGNIKLPWRLAKSFIRAKYLLQKYKPHVVVGTGGYASAPLLFMAALYGYPTLVQEQNALPGYTNRILGKWVDKICVAYPGLEKYFPAHKIVVTGSPLRTSISSVPSSAQSTESKNSALQVFGLVPNKPCVLVMGGSLGASSLNEAFVKAIPVWEEAGIQILLQTGRAHFNAVHTELEKWAVSPVVITPFLENIEIAYLAADIVVARAGALTIAELCAVQKPTVFVPSPHVAENHQYHNALHLAEAGAALLVPDSDLQEKLPQTVLQLLNNPLQRQLLQEKMQQFHFKNAAQAIVQEIQKLVQDRKMAIR